MIVPIQRQPSTALTCTTACSTTTELGEFIEEDVSTCPFLGRSTKCGNESETYAGELPSSWASASLSTILIVRTYLSPQNLLSKPSTYRRHRWVSSCLLTCGHIRCCKFLLVPCWTE